MPHAALGAALLLAIVLPRGARAVLLDEEASTAQRTFEGSVARRSSKPLTTIEDVPEWIRLTFADKYMGGAAQRPAHAQQQHARAAAQEDAEDEEWGAEEFLDQGDAAADEERDIFEPPPPKEHAALFEEMEEHEHAAPARRRHGRRRMHPLGSDGQAAAAASHAPLTHDELEAADARRKRGPPTKDWGGGGVDAMMSMLEQHSLVEAHAHTETLGASRRARRAAAARPLPSLQGRTPTPSARPHGGGRPSAHAQQPPPSQQPVFLQSASGAMGQQSTPVGWDASLTAEQQQYAQRSAIAAEASQRALRQLGLLDEAPTPGGSGGGFGGGSGIAGSFLQQSLGGYGGGYGGGGGMPVEHWQERYVDSVLADLGLGVPGGGGGGGGLGPAGRASREWWRAAGSFYDGSAFPPPQAMPSGG